MIGKARWKNVRRYMVCNSLELNGHASVVFIGRPKLQDATVIAERWTWASMKTRPWGITIPLQCAPFTDSKRLLGNSRPPTVFPRKGGHCGRIAGYRRRGKSHTDYESDQVKLTCKCKASVTYTKPKYFSVEKVIITEDDGFWFWHKLDL